MAKQTTAQLKAWFRKGLYPTERHFSDLIDSFRHKDEEVAPADVTGLTEALNKKYDKTEAQQLEGTVDRHAARIKQIDDILQNNDGSKKGLPDGIAGLDSFGHVPEEQDYREVLFFDGFTQGVVETKQESTVLECKVYFSTGSKIFYASAGEGDNYGNWPGAERFGSMTLAGKKPYADKVYIDRSSGLAYYLEAGELKALGNDIPAWKGSGEESIKLNFDGNKAEGQNSTAEGINTRAAGNNSHAEGEETQALSLRTHAEGYRSIAGLDDGSWGYASHAEGFETKARGAFGAHSEGYQTLSQGNGSHSEGFNTEAIGSYSHAEGFHTVAEHDAEHAEGFYNQSNEDTLSSIGNGTADKRHNAFEVKKDGSILIADTEADGAPEEKPMMNLQETVGQLKRLYLPMPPIKLSDVKDKSEGDFAHAAMPTDGDADERFEKLKDAIKHYRPVAVPAFYHDDRFEDEGLVLVTLQSTGADAWPQQWEGIGGNEGGAKPILTIAPEPERLAFYFNAPNGKTLVAEFYTGTSGTTSDKAIMADYYYADGLVTSVQLEAAKKQLVIEQWNNACRIQTGNASTVNPKIWGQYNKETDSFDIGHYSFTYEQAVGALQYYPQIAYGGVSANTVLYSFKGKVARVVLPVYFPTHGSSNVNAFSWCDNAVVIAIHGYYGEPVYGNWNNAFADCISLKEILGTICPNTTCKLFAGRTKNIERVNIGIKFDLDISNAGKILFEHFRYMVDNANNPDAITVTVHADVYAALTGAAAEYPFNEGSQEEWQQLLADAVEKQISFATA